MEYLLACSKPRKMLIISISRVTTRADWERRVVADAKEHGWRTSRGSLGTTAGILTDGSAGRFDEDCSGGEASVADCCGALVVGSCGNDCDATAGCEGAGGGGSWCGV